MPCNWIKSSLYCKSKQDKEARFYSLYDKVWRIEPVFEADFHDCSYGYRPKRDAKQASLAIREDLYNRAWGVVEIDFKSYFDYAS
jgi:hypothetical protein